MAALNYFLGLKRGTLGNPGEVSAATTTQGTAVDVEVRLQINNGSNATGLTRKDASILLELIADYIEQGGITGSAGVDLPPL